MDIASAALHLQAAKYFQVAAFVMLAYDHTITFGQEVERIWMRPKSFAALLFLLNRYATLIQFIIIVIAFNDPGWTGKFDRCDNYVLFEGVCTVALVAIGQLIMILRVVALYKGNKRLFAFLVCLLIGEIIVSIVGLKSGFAVPLPPGFIGCILTGSNTFFPSVWITPLITDSCIFILTIYRTRNNIGRLFTPFTTGGASVTDRAITILLRDGVVYYLLIFLVNLMNVLIYFLAVPDIKPIGASFSQLLTCTVISRLVLNLRSLSNGNQNSSTTAKTLSFQVNRTPPKQLEAIWTRTLNDFTDDSSPLTSETDASGEVSLKPVTVTHPGHDHDQQV